MKAMIYTLENQTIDTQKLRIMIHSYLKHIKQIDTFIPTEFKKSDFEGFINIKEKDKINTDDESYNFFIKFYFDVPLKKLQEFVEGNGYGKVYISLDFKEITIMYHSYEDEGNLVKGNNWYNKPDYTEREFKKEVQNIMNIFDTLYIKNHFTTLNIVDNIV